MKITLENKQLIAYKIKHTFNIPPSNSTPRLSLKRSERIYLHKDLDTDIYSGFIHDSPKLAAIQMSSSGFMDTIQQDRAVV